MGPRGEKRGSAPRLEQGCRAEYPFPWSGELPHCPAMLGELDDHGIRKALTDAGYYKRKKSGGAVQAFVQLAKLGYKTPWEDTPPTIAELLAELCQTASSNKRVRPSRSSRPTVSRTEAPPVRPRLRPSQGIYRGHTSEAIHSAPTTLHRPLLRQPLLRRPSRNSLTHPLTCRLFRSHACCFWELGLFMTRPGMGRTPIPRGFTPTTSTTGLATGLAFNHSST